MVKKNIHQKILWLCILWVGIFAHVASVTAQEIDASFRALILENTNTHLYTDDEVLAPAQKLYGSVGFGQKCFKALHAFYDAGEYFDTNSMPKTDKLIKTLSYTLEDYFTQYQDNNNPLFQSRSGSPQNNIFYHYFYRNNDHAIFKSEIKNMEDLLTENQFDLNSAYPSSDTENSKKTLETFLWESRTSTKSFGTSISFGIGQQAFGVLYAAAGPLSSMNYGDTLLSMEFDPNHTRIFPLFGFPAIGQLTNAIKTDLRSLHDDLLSCTIDKLFFPVLEDFNIDLIHYASTVDWFHVLRSKNLRAIRAQQVDAAKDLDTLQPIFNKVGREGELDLTLEPGGFYTFREFYHFGCVE